MSDDPDRLFAAPRQATTCSNCGLPMFPDTQCGGCGWLHQSPKPAGVSDDTGEFEPLPPPPPASDPPGGEAGGA